MENHRLLITARRSWVRLAALGAFCALFGSIFFTGTVLGQIGGGKASSAGSDREGSNSPSGAAVMQVDQSAFSGSVPEGEATSGVLPILFKEAIDRGLRNNLGLLLQSDNSIAARGQKWKELSNLLPNLRAGVSENAMQTDLQAAGLRFPGFPKVIGPFGFFDARVYLTQNVLDLHALDRERGAAENERAAAYSYKDAREMVVLAVGNTYLVALADAARVDTAQAEVQTAQALYDKAADQQKAGVSPAIDTLRAHVELQTRQQQLIQAQTTFDKQKLALARVIGLPPGQQFALTDKAPYEPLAALGIDESLRRAYASRADYQAAQRQVRAAEHFRKAATAEHLPTVGVSADYGDIGIAPGNSHGTFTAAASLNIPIFQGNKAHADTLQAEASLRDTQARLADLRGKIDYEVRSALLDLNSAANQVEVARSAVQLANETLNQAKDRFAAGVTDNLEVVQAQETVASANESYISSLYYHNVAKVALAKAIGYAEEGVRLYLQSK